MSEEIRQRILEAAQSCFKSRGYAGASITQICARAQIAPATLYRYFHNKRALFEEIGAPDLPAGGSARRAAILKAALDTFSREGYRGATMTEISACAGAARATLYTLFPTKEALISELLQENPLVELIQDLSGSTGAHSDGSPEQQLEQLSRLFLLSLQDPRRIALLRLIISENMRLEPVRRAYHQMVYASVTAFTRYLEALLPGIPDHEFAARFFLATLLGFILTQSVIPGTTLPVYSVDELALRVTTQFWEGIKGACQG